MTVSIPKIVPAPVLGPDEIEAFTAYTPSPFPVTSIVRLVASEANNPNEPGSCVGIVVGALITSYDDDTRGIDVLTIRYEENGGLSSKALIIPPDFLELHPNPPAELVTIAKNILSGISSAIYDDTVAPTVSSPDTVSGSTSADTVTTASTATA